MESRKDAADRASGQAGRDPARSQEGSAESPELKIEWTSAGILISGSIDPSDTREVLLRLEAFLSEATGKMVERSESGGESADSVSRPEGSTSGREPAQSGVEEVDALNWDDLIPIAPPRPSRRIRVRLKKVGRDRPLPAEDPWAK